MNGDFSIKVTDSRVCEGCKEKNWCKKDCDSYKFELGTEELGDYFSSNLEKGEIIVIHENLGSVVFGYYDGIEPFEDTSIIKVTNARTYDSEVKKLGTYVVPITDDLLDISIGKEAVVDTLRKRLPGMSRFFRTIRRLRHR